MGDDDRARAASWINHGRDRAATPCDESLIRAEGISQPLLMLLVSSLLNGRVQWRAIFRKHKHKGNLLELSVVEDEVGGDFFVSDLIGLPIAI